MAFRVVVPGGSLNMVADPTVAAITYDANGNYVSGGIQFGTCVKLNTAGSSLDAIAAVANNYIAGVACEDPAVGPGQEFEVQFLGVAKCLAGAAVALGALVSTDATGRVVTAAAPAATSQPIVGTALEAAAAAGDLIAVQLTINASTNVNV